MRRLEELDRLDREYGLGTMPSAYSDPAGDQPPGYGPPGQHRAPRPRRTTGPLVPGLLISGIILAVILLRDPGMTGYRFGQFVDQFTGSDQRSYAFVATTNRGEPIGWNHCDPIRFVVNPQGAPKDWETVVGQAVEMVSEASDFSFHYAGTSEERDFTPRPMSVEAAPPVLIAWADSSEVPDLEGLTAGIGGATPVRVRGRVQYVTGTVVLDTATYDRLSQQGDRRSASLILAHELGHVLGLDHVPDPDELMNAEYIGQDGFGPGDREGFKRLSSLPCH